MVIYFNVGDVVVIWLWEIHIPMQSVPITSNVLSSNLAPGEVYLIQPDVMFVNDLQQVGGYLWVLHQ
jgi:hypothetical protein